MKKTNENAKTKKKHQLTANLEENVKQLQSEREPPRLGLRKHRRKPSSKVAYTFLSFGIISLASSIIYNSSILAFIGLGLTLWGGLFLFIKPARYVRANLLDSTAISSLTAIDKILTELNYHGKGIYLPPRQLNELKEVVVFVPKKNKILIPQPKEIAQGKVFINPDGMFLIPPGQGLLTLYEKELGKDLSKVNLNNLSTDLPKLLIEDLELLESLEISTYKDGVHVKIVGSVYESLCSQVRNHTNICSRLGCPLCSSIACALAKATGKPVVIERNELSADGKTVEICTSLSRIDVHATQVT